MTTKHKNKKLVAWFLFVILIIVAVIAYGYRDKYYAYLDRLESRKADQREMVALTNDLLSHQDLFIHIAQGNYKSSCFIISPYDGSVALGNLLGATQNVDLTRCGDVFYVPWVSYNLDNTYHNYFNHLKYILESSQERRFDYIAEDFTNGPELYNYRQLAQSAAFDQLKDIFTKYALETKYQDPIFIRYQHENKNVTSFSGQRTLLELQVEKQQTAPQNNDSNK